MQVYWNYLLPTTLQALAFLHREGEYPECPWWTSFAWLIDDAEFRSFQDQLWQAHLAARISVNHQQATMNTILEACLFNKESTIRVNAKLGEIAATASETAALVATTAAAATGTAAELAETKKMVLNLQQQVAELTAVGCSSIQAAGQGSSSGWCS